MKEVNMITTLTIILTGTALVMTVVILYLVWSITAKPRNVQFE